MAVMVMILMLQASEGQWWQFLSLFAGGGLSFVGAAPLFKGQEKTIHYVSAGVCAVSAWAWMWLGDCGLIPAATLTACGVIATCFGKPVFWIETGLFTGMLIALSSV
jgi:hypothetical protein